MMSSSARVNTCDSPAPACGENRGEDRTKVSAEKDVGSVPTPFCASRDVARAKQPPTPGSLEVSGGLGLVYEIESFFFGGATMTAPSIIS